MRKTILAALCVTVIGIAPFAASAQTTGPQSQDTTKMGTETGMAKDGMAKTSKKSSMKKTSMKKSSMMKGDMKQ